VNLFVTFQLVIFGGMNDQKDFNDVCILQTRAALKHLPSEMTGIIKWNAVKALVSDHLGNSEKWSQLEVVAYESGLS